mmetsp:Transcript_1987/g.5008  ORF Transcript_1987/g.5008 Transcript_1987/m.5008 type:complete len:991 (+) Transcript_1987:265-3237(+)
MALSWEGWVTLAVMVVGLVVMATDVIGPDFVFLGMLGTLLVSTILELKPGLSGFANTGLLTVMILFPVAEGIARTGGLDSLFAKLLGKPSTLLMAQVRMAFPVAVLSAFLNNTPIVALLVPLIFAWSKSAPSIHAQKLLIPLSYASILGGTCTLIGTSTNLVIAGLQAERAQIDPDVPVFGMFDITVYGVPYMIFGILYMLIFSPWLLPPTQEWGKCRSVPPAEEHEELLVGLQVSRSSPVVGKTIEAAGLRALDGLFLASVERGGYAIPAVGPEFQLAAHDILFFTGDIKATKDLIRSHGLVYVTDENEEHLQFSTFGSPRTFQMRSPTKESPRANGRYSVDSAAPVLQAADSANGVVRHRRPDTSEIHDHLGDAVDSSQGASTSHDFALSRVSAPARPLRGMAIMPGTHALPTNTHALPRAGSLEYVPPSSPPSPNVGLPDGLQASINLSEPPSPGKSERGHIVEVVLKAGSELIGHSIRQVGFRGKLNASVIAVIRDGVRVPGKLGDIVLAAEDKIIMDVSDQFDRYSSVLQSNFKGMSFAESEAREFMAPMVVVSSSALVGKTIQQAGLRGLPGLFLVAIDRANGESLHAVEPSTLLEAGDCLWFSGDVEAIGGLRKVAGLRHQEEYQAEKIGIEAIHRRLVQAVVAGGAHLAGRSVKRLAFRTRYGAAILAVHRQGERLRCKIGEVVLKAGDVLLLDTGAGFVEKYMYDTSFALVAEVENSTPPNTKKMLIASLFGIAMVATQIIGAFTVEFMDLFTAALIAAGGMLATGCLTGSQARKSVNWDIYVTIGAAFGVSVAMEETGVAVAIANLLVAAGEAMGGQLATLVAIYLGTALLSNIIANNAAAAIMFPISFEVAERLGIDYNIMSVTLMLGASSCFSTPFGYQTNLMVFGAGGYRTMDFVRFGGPMQLWLLFAFAFVIWTALNKTLWILLIASIAAAAAIIAYPFLKQMLGKRKLLKHSASSSGPSFNTPTTVIASESITAV